MKLSLPDFTIIPVILLFVEKQDGLKLYANFCKNKRIDCVVLISRERVAFQALVYLDIRLDEF